MHMMALFVNFFQYLPTPKFDTNNKPLLIEKVLLSILEKLFSKFLNFPDVNRRLRKIISILSSDQPPCPQLYLYSTTDNVIPARSAESFIQEQKKSGRKLAGQSYLLRLQGLLRTIRMENASRGNDDVGLEAAEDGRAVLSQGLLSTTARVMTGATMTLYYLWNLMLCNSLIELNFK
ncbi:uncharacterized protein LOC131247413 isoform X1 [Magnolia sinica]|uniref:uncharacterized protein LOC131247413 isoform X1 n=1 Tax=Magnolia sinica TaxID=86752 RepID=UPI00265A8ABE|nr:uncharacterized protein LOC131247413 isoform X1 [Magnolia sinica]